MPILLPAASHSCTKSMVTVAISPFVVVIDIFPLRPWTSIDTSSLVSVENVGSGVGLGDGGGVGGKVGSAVGYGVGNGVGAGLGDAKLIMGSY